MQKLLCKAIFPKLRMILSSVMASCSQYMLPPTPFQGISFLPLLNNELIISLFGKCGNKHDFEPYLHLINQSVHYFKLKQLMNHGFLTVHDYHVPLQMMFWYWSLITDLYQVALLQPLEGLLNHVTINTGSKRADVAFKILNTLSGMVLGISIHGQKQMMILHHKGCKIWWRSMIFQVPDRHGILDKLIGWLTDLIPWLLLCFSLVSVIHG